MTDTQPSTGEEPRTLSIDVGGTGIKASVLDAHGTMLHDRVRALTKYPMPPDSLVAAIHELCAGLPEFERISVAFPGVVRNGHVITAPAFVTVAGLGTDEDPALVSAWHRFDLAGGLAGALQRPARVLNDADMQGLDVVQGQGVEVVITLGTGFGSAFFEDGRLGPHLEMAHHRFRKSQTYNEQLGDAARKDVGTERWNNRVVKAIANLRVLANFDHLYIGGGNAKKLTIELDPDVSVVDNTAGILGGIRLWDGPALPH
ncbi:MAG TPA: ROK family protein [Acidimicrobiia bacterium]|jgi:polyphosphate glucokinase